MAEGQDYVVNLRFTVEDLKDPGVMQEIIVDQRKLDYENMVILQTALTRAITEAMLALGQAGIQAKKLKK